MYDLLLGGFPLQHLDVFPGLPDCCTSLHQRTVGVTFGGLCTGDSLTGTDDAGVLVVVAVEQATAGTARGRARVRQAVTTAVAVVLGGRLATFVEEAYASGRSVGGRRRVSRMTGVGVGGGVGCSRGWLSGRLVSEETHFG